VKFQYSFIVCISMTDTGMASGQLLRVH